MPKKYLIFDKNDELFIFNSQKEKGIRVTQKENKLYITELNNKINKCNMDINTMNWDNLVRFCVFDKYYLEMMSLDVPEKIMKQLNELMNYHFESVYGKQYIKNNCDVKKVDYESIIMYED